MKIKNIQDTTILSLELTREEVDVIDLFCTYNITIPETFRKLINADSEQVKIIKNLMDQLRTALLN